MGCDWIRKTIQYKIDQKYRKSSISQSENATCEQKTQAKNRIFVHKLFSHFS